jgi:hypothetical protein
LLELNDSKRQIKNAPGIVFHDKTFPENVVAAFPGAIKNRTTCGSVSLKVSDFHLKKGLE